MKTRQLRKKAAPRARKKGNATKKGKRKDNIVFMTLAVGAAGILGYLGWQYLRKKRASSATGNNADLYAMLSRSGTGTNTSGSSIPATTSTSQVIASTLLPGTGTGSSGSKTNNTNGFPLKKGSKGANVKTLQQALIAKYGATILPRYGADGDFGSETVAAVNKAGLPASIDETTFFVFIQGSSGNIDKSAIAAKLLDAANRKDLSTILNQLKLLKTKEDYRQVSEIFSQSRLRGVRQTLVNGLLDTFTSETQKQQIRYEFVRMGLKYDGTKWSLDGFDGRPIVTTEPASVWITATESLQVPSKMVLGAEVTRRLDYTLFENAGRYFLVATRSVKYL